MTQQSYLTVKEATELLTNTIGAESWLSLTESNKNASLIQASFLLDSNFDWVGSITDQAQELRWPRTGVVDRDNRQIPSNTIPQSIKYATALMALHLTKAGGISTVTTNLKSLKVGPISLSMDSDESITSQVVPKMIVSLINSLGFYTGLSDNSTAYNVQVLR